MFGANAFGWIYFGDAYVGAHGTDRFSQLLTELEYASPTEYRRITQLLTELEYAGATDFRRVTQILTQYEYYRPWTSGPGPAIQLTMG